MGRQHDFRMNNAAFSCIVVGQSVPLVCQLLSGAVGCCGYGRFALSARDADAVPDAVNDSKGFGLLWPYSLMQLGMNSNKSADTLAGSYALFAFSCLFWLAAMFALAWLLLRRQDVRA